MSDGSVDAHGLGDLGRRPFSLVYVEVEEDPTSRRILQRGNGSVDLGEWFITHTGSLSTANADGRAQGEIPSLRRLWSRALRTRSSEPL